MSQNDDVTSSTLDRAGVLPRRPRRVPDHLGASIAALILMLVMAAFAIVCPVPWLRLLAVFAPAGFVPLAGSLSTRKLAAQGRVDEARTRSQQTIDRVWTVIGAALILHVVGSVGTLLFTRGKASARTGRRPKTVFEVYFDWDFLGSADVWRAISKGFLTNVSLALLAQAFILVWSLIIAVIRMLPGNGTRPIRALVVAYGDLFRSLPGILVVLIINYGFQASGLPLISGLSQYQYACIALVLLYGAYVSEVFRAGLESVHPSQISGARSLGLSYTQTLRYVSIPQAVRRVIPPLLNDFIALQKDTAILGFIGVAEVVARARFISTQRSTLTSYTIAATLFFLITIPQARFADRLLRKQQDKQFGRSKLKGKPIDFIGMMSTKGNGAK
jgi:polar amino acid transport system permease protein